MADRQTTSRGIFPLSLFFMPCAHVSESSDSVNILWTKMLTILCPALSGSTHFASEMAALRWRASLDTSDVFNSGTNLRPVIGVTAEDKVDAAVEFGVVTDCVAAEKDGVSGVP